MRHTRVSVDRGNCVILHSQIYVQQRRDGTRHRVVWPPSLGTDWKSSEEEKSLHLLCSSKKAVRSSMSCPCREGSDPQLWQTEVWRQKAFSPIDGVERRNRADAHQPRLWVISPPRRAISPLPQGDITQEHGARREKGSATRKRVKAFLFCPSLETIASESSWRSQL